MSPPPLLLHVLLLVMLLLLVLITIMEYDYFSIAISFLFHHLPQTLHSIFQNIMQRPALSSQRPDDMLESGQMNENRPSQQFVWLDR